MAMEIALGSVFTALWFVTANKNKAHKIAIGHIAGRSNAITQISDLLADSFQLKNLG